MSAASQLPLAHTPPPRMHPTKEPHVPPRVCLLVWKFSKLAFESKTLEPWNQNRSSGEWFKLKPMREVFVHTSGDLRQRCVVCFLCSCQSTVLSTSPFWWWAACTLSSCGSITLWALNPLLGQRKEEKEHWQSARPCTGKERHSHCEPIKTNSIASGRRRT